MFNQQELKNLVQRWIDNIRSWKLKPKKCGFCWYEAYYKLKKKRVRYIRDLTEEEREFWSALFVDLDNNEGFTLIVIMLHALSSSTVFNSELSMLVI